MFTEVPDVRQITGEPRRRWWIDADLELIVWFDKNNRMIAFQLCYTIDGHQKALTWRERHGYFHKSTPILIMNGIFDKETVGNRLTKSAQGLPGEIASFVQQKISEYRTGKK